MQPRTRKMKKKQKQPRNKGVIQTTSPGAFRQLTLVFPPRVKVKLRFNAFQLLSLAATTGANYRWRPTAAFDVDPALGGTSMAGFAELAAYYATYRVYASTIFAAVSNTSTVSPIILIVTPYNADPTNAMSVSNIIASIENPYARTRDSGLLGCPPTTVKSFMTTQKIFGDPAVFYDHNFSSLVTTIPTNNWFWNVAILAPATIATAISLHVNVDVDIEFFDRSFLPN